MPIYGTCKTCGGETIDYGCVNCENRAHKDWKARAEKAEADHQQALAYNTHQQKVIREMTEQLKKAIFVDDADDSEEGGIRLPSGAVVPRAEYHRALHEYAMKCQTERDEARAEKVTEYTTRLQGRISQLEADLAKRITEAAQARIILHSVLPVDAPVELCEAATALKAKLLEVEAERNEGRSKEVSGLWACLTKIEVDYWPLARAGNQKAIEALMDPNLDALCEALGVKHE